MSKCALDNIKVCKCPNATCNNHGKCCVCISYHEKNKSMVFCQKEILLPSEKN
jgi:hypothetical protein